MEFTKEQNGVYFFKGLDTWTNKEIQGHIVYQPYDVASNKVWSVVFDKDGKNPNSAFFGPTLKSCKQWLTV